MACDTLTHAVSSANDRRTGSIYSMLMPGRGTRKRHQRVEGIFAVMLDWIVKFAAAGRVPRCARGA